MNETKDSDTGIGTWTKGIAQIERREGLPFDISLSLAGHCLSRSTVFYYH